MLYTICDYFWLGCGYLDDVHRNILFLLAVPVAVTVARTTDELSPRDPLPFPDVVVDVGDAWDRLVVFLPI